MYILDFGNINNFLRLGDQWELKGYYMERKVNLPFNLWPYSGLFGQYKIMKKK